MQLVTRTKEFGQACIWLVSIQSMYERGKKELRSGYQPSCFRELNTQLVESRKIIILQRFGKITTIHQIYAFIAIWLQCWLCTSVVHKTITNTGTPKPVDIVRLEIQDFIRIAQSSNQTENVSRFPLHAVRYQLSKVVMW